MMSPLQFYPLQYYHTVYYSSCLSSWDDNQASHIQPFSTHFNHPLLHSTFIEYLIFCVLSLFWVVRLLHTGFFLLILMSTRGFPVSLWASQPPRSCSLCVYSCVSYPNSSIKQTATVWIYIFLFCFEDAKSASFSICYCSYKFVMPQLYVLVTHRGIHLVWRSFTQKTCVQKAL